MALEKSVEKTNKKGLPVKALYVPRLEMEYWLCINELKKAYELKQFGEVIRFALKKATGKC